MGRHSAPDDDDDDGVIAAGDTVVAAPPAGATRPRPGRHAHADDDPDSGDSGDENTAQITPIVDPVLDEPLPAAMTTVIVPVRDDEPVDEGGLVDDLLTDSPPDDVPAATGKKGKQPKPKAEKPPKAVKQPKAPKPTKSPKPPKPSKAAKRAEASTAETLPEVAPEIAPVEPPAGASALELSSRDTPVAPEAPAVGASADSPFARPADPAWDDRPFGSVLPVEPTADDVAASAAEPVTESAADGKRTRPESHVSDRTLLARDASARARVIAAVVVPFVLYVAVLLVLDEFELRTALIWIWLPLITAGVVAGLILDLAHRAAAARAIVALEDRVSDR